jgi:type II secretory pathway component PulJ
VGLILDLAVVAVTLVVLGSLALLAWTVAIGATRAAERGRTRIAELRREVAAAEARITTTADRHREATSE